MSVTYTWMLEPLTVEAKLKEYSQIPNSFDGFSFILDDGNHTNCFHKKSFSFLYDLIKLFCMTSILF